MSTLGSLLVKNRVASVVQIEKALQRQVIHGGDLSTNLLELSAVDEDALTRYAGRAFGMPVLDRVLLETPDDKVVKMMPWAKAEEHRIVPVRMDGNKMLVAASAPIQENALEEISFLLGIEFLAHFVLDFRLALALKQCFGIPLSKRYRALKKKLAPNFDIDGPPIVPSPENGTGLLSGVDPSSEEQAPEAAVEEEVIPRGEEQAQKEVTEEESEDGKATIPADSNYMATVIHSVSSSSGADVDTADGESVTPRPPSGGELEKLVSEPTDPEHIRLSLEQAKERDEILEIFMGVAGELFEFAMLFVIHGSTAKARSRVTESSGLQRIEAPALRIDAGGMFETAFKTASFYLGAPGKSDADKEAFEKMERRRPRNCAIFPVVLRGRVIVLLYGDSGALGVKADQVSELTRVTRLVAQAFDRILLEKKYGEYRARASRLPSRPAHRALSRVPKATERDFADAAGLYRSEKAEPTGKVKLDAKIASQTSSRSSVIPEYAPEAKWAQVAASVDQAILGGTPDVGSEIEKTTTPPDDPIGLVENTATDEAKPPIRTSHIVSLRSDASSRAPDKKGEIESLIQRVLQPGAQDKEALDRLVGMGEAAAEALVAHFPGPLTCDRYQEAGNLRRVGRHGPLLDVLTRFGKTAVPHLIPLLESRDTDVRFYATFLFSELKFPETLEALSDRLFDRDRQVRAIAVDVIRGYRPHPEYHLAVKKVIDLLEMPSRDMEAKQIAAVVLGELGEPVAISVLVKMLGSVDAKLLKNSHQALIRICFQDFGYSEKIWFIWYDENRERHRLEWAMDGLTGASEETRRLALQELKRTLSESAPVDAEPGNMLEYRALQEALRAWWEETGRDIHHYKKDD